MSKIEVDEIVNQTGDNDSGIDLSTNDNIKFKIANSQKAVIDATGNVGIGSTSPSTYVDGSDGETLVLEASGTNRGAIVFASECTGGEGEILGLINFTDTANSSTNKRGASIKGIRGSSDTNPFLTFTTADTERMRIDSSGRILIAKTTTSTSTKGLEIRTTGSDAGRINHSTSAEAFYFYDSADGAQVGYIIHNGSGTTFGSGSDYRLKENIVTDWDATTRLKQLKPTRFSWKKESKSEADTDGFLAHEVSSIVPQAVRGEKDAVDADGNPDYQGVDQSKLVPLLTKALQEAIAKIETLEAKVTALESK